MIEENSKLIENEIFLFLISVIFTGSLFLVFMYAILA